MAEQEMEQGEETQAGVLTEAILVEEYGFPESARLLGPEEVMAPGDYIVDPENRHIMLIGKGCTYQAHKKNMLASKLRQRATKRPDLARFCYTVRIAPGDAPLTHQLALLPVGSRVEAPAGKIGITTPSGLKYRNEEIEFTDILPNMIANLHPPARQAGAKPQQGRHRPGKKP